MINTCTEKPNRVATPLFVDTSAHYALADANDPDHAACVSLLQRVPRLGYALVTSNYVVSETYTLLRQRIGWEAARSYIEALRAGSTQIVRILADDEQRAWEILQQYKDQDFSYVDATSFAVMERLGISTFFALDSHFSIFRTRSGQAFTDLQFTSSA